MSPVGGKENGSRASSCECRQNPKRKHTSRCLGRCSAGSGGRCQPGEEILPCGLRRKCIFESSAIDGDEIVQRKAGFHGGRKVFKQRRAKHGGIVGGESDRGGRGGKFGKGGKRGSGMRGVQLDTESVGAQIAGKGGFERDCARLGR